MLNVSRFTNRSNKKEWVSNTAFNDISLIQALSSSIFAAIGESPTSS